MNSSRRAFFKNAIGSAAAVLAAPALLKSLFPAIANAADKKAAGAAVAYVKPGQGMAASVNYVEVPSKAKKDLQIDRMGVKFKDQKCSSCMLYTKDAGGNYGKCALFPNEMVKADAWCSSWSKKG